MRRAALAMVIVWTVTLLGAGSARADESWHSEQPLATGGLQLSLGEIGDIEFWAPNRGVLITAGVGALPAGVYAYNGVGWHLYSTVCGGHRGSIAWEGPDDFWTVADQPVGQENVGSVIEEPWNRSLCHFEGGRVVASYAEPLGASISYLHLNSAACRPGTPECWFAGERLPGALNTGAFHLVWNGSSVTSYPSLTESQALGDPARTVSDLAFDSGLLYESVTVGKDDGTVPGEPDAAQPSYIHIVSPGSPEPFLPLFATKPLEYGRSMGSELGPFRFADAGEGLYAIAGARKSSATVTLVSIVGGQVEQIPLAPNETFQPGDEVEAAAAEPGTGVIWVAYHEASEPAEPPATKVVAVHTDGTVGPPIRLTGPNGGLKGRAKAIACPATDQCWVGSEGGWLFHLGGQLPRDEDPAMTGVISFRPADNSTPALPPFELPADDSGAEVAKAVPPAEILAERLPPHRKPKRLISKVKQTLIKGRVLQLAFTLYVRAHVRLIAKRHGKVVAETPPLTLGRGHHRIRLRLDPKKWPTHLDFKVHPAKASGKKK